MPAPEQRLRPLWAAEQVRSHKLHSAPTQRAQRSGGRGRCSSHSHAGGCDRPPLTLSRDSTALLGPLHETSTSFSQATMANVLLAALEGDSRGTGSLHYFVRAMQQRCHS